jgi:hypothetical protein
MMVECRSDLRGRKAGAQNDEGMTAAPINRCRL